MKITVFTANQLRHRALVNGLAEIADQVFVFHESHALQQMQSAILRDYFIEMEKAEEEVFENQRFSPKNIFWFPISSEELKKFSFEKNLAALQSDLYLIFGSSFIQGDLCKFLVEKEALNLHMGVSPYYRGAASNFWALYDGRIDLVGATIHRVTEGLDSGPILFHCLPKTSESTASVLGMRAVRAGHLGLIQMIRNGTLKNFTPIPQNKDLQLRYSKKDAFTEKIAEEFLLRPASKDKILRALRDRKPDLYTHPFFA